MKDKRDEFVSLIAKIEDLKRICEKLHLNLKLIELPLKRAIEMTSSAADESSSEAANQ